MPTLLDIQRGIYRSLAIGDDSLAAPYVIDGGLSAEARLNIYRNTFLASLTTALHLTFPAVHKLVGAEFFEYAAGIFIEAQPPTSAYLDEYGSGFPEFLSNFEPARSLPYLPHVAKLEWAVSAALHADDVEPMDISLLAALSIEERSLVHLIPHPSITLLQSDYPVDVIWRAVLSQDENELAQVRLDSGAVWLLVERRANTIEVVSCDQATWWFAKQLFSSLSVEAAIESASTNDVDILLAGHLAAGRFVGLTLSGRGPGIRENVRPSDE
ncbi:putative DNA-binding domain-containing protein [Methylosinus sp. H3A]|uniref:HvfC/BufC N-terminal domain-containing protein n=1 Tax=Methylosinus sp. H3A TaxID=2785786 RepID=UPI0018C20372|nr:DNA-binding domain-containing protein [Methylosinus sp. H3A]MBG0808027.1 putative DNA-binding domain-containing protein [Methylosinus sp. H3A]